MPRATRRPVAASVPPPSRALFSFARAPARSTVRRKTRRVALGLSMLAFASTLAAADYASPGSDAPPPATPPAIDNEPSGDAVHELDVLLRRPEFNRWRQWGGADQSSLAQYLPEWNVPQRPGWLDRCVDWLRERFQRDAPSLPSPNLPFSPLHAALKPVVWILVALVALMLVVGVVREWRNRRRRKGATAVLHREKLREAMDRGDALAADEDDWRAGARAFHAEGDARGAYRALYLALLASLHRHRWIVFKPARTNWAYVRGFRGPVPSRDAFAALTETFDECWYGGRQPSLDEFPALEARADQLARDAENAVDSAPAPEQLLAHATLHAAALRNPPTAEGSRP